MVSSLSTLQNLTWRLTPTWRKTILILHVISGIGWMGVDIALLVLLITARTTDDPALVASGFNAIRMSVPVAVPPLVGARQADPVADHDCARLCGACARGQRDQCPRRQRQQRRCVARHVGRFANRSALSALRFVSHAGHGDGSLHLQTVGPHAVDSFRKDDTMKRSRPVLIGKGIRLFDNLQAGDIELERIGLDATAKLTSLRFRVIKS
jgi:hypothetical protein